MSLTVAQIAKQAFDGVAAALGGVIKSATIKRAKTTDYDVETGDVTKSDVNQTCRMVFGGAGAGDKYFPELVIADTDEVAFIEGAGANPPKENDTLYLTDGASWLVTKPPRDIVQGGGLWVAIVRRV